MILIISKELKTKDMYSKDISELFKEYSISHILHENEKEILIIPQKVVLTEVDMNYVFSVGFVRFEYEMEYANIGGEGCDFSLELT
jgi:hypothetical protein